jgi:hypothetical protein
MTYADVVDNDTPSAQVHAVRDPFMQATPSLPARR